jgi:hypothetical protein
VGRALKEDIGKAGWGAGWVEGEGGWGAVEMEA